MYVESLPVSDCFQRQIFSACPSGVGFTKVLGGEQLQQSLVFFG